MITVLQTHSPSWAEAARVALIGAGIEAVVLDPYSPGTLGLYGSVRVAIVNDEDQEEAKRIVADLRPPHEEVSPSWWWHKRAMLAFGAAFLIAILGTPMAESSSKPRLALAFAYVGAALFLTAIVLILLGHRADKRAKAQRDAALRRS